MTRTGKAALVEEWARTVVTAVDTAYPWAAQHVVAGPDDVDVTPARRHPAFHGSFDWHSCVHMLASGVTLLGLDPDPLTPATRARLTALLDARLRPEFTAVEARVLRRRPSFEQPYGRAWALRLAQVVRGTRWADAVAPIAEVVLDALPGWLARLDRPIRTGTHENTAFSLGLARDAAGALGRPDTVAAIDAYARAAYGADADYPVGWEPGGHDFLSAALSEATLMARVLAAGEFGAWLTRFHPALGTDADPLLGVVRVTDPSDGHAAHLLGLALSRAWHLRELAGWVDDERAARMRAAADVQVAAVAGHVTGGDFMSTHWLVSFALAAELSGRRPTVL